MVLVFLDDSSSVLVGVERVHEDEGDVDAVGRVEVLSLQHRPCRIFWRLTSICRTERSRKVMLSRTSMTDLGPTQPMVVPKPPFNFNTASLLRMDGSTLGRTSYFRTCSGLGASIFSQSLKCQHAGPYRVGNSHLLALGTFGEESVEEEEEGLHLGLEDLT